MEGMSSVGGLTTNPQGPSFDVRRLQRTFCLCRWRGPRERNSVPAAARIQMPAATGLPPAAAASGAGMLESSEASQCGTRGMARVSTERDSNGVRLAASAGRASTNPRK